MVKMLLGAGGACLPWWVVHLPAKLHGAVTDCTLTSCVGMSSMSMTRCTEGGSCGGVGTDECGNVLLVVRLLV